MSRDTVWLSLKEIEALALKKLVGAGALTANAAPLARATMQAERDGIASHGLMYLPTYVEHLRCGKVDGRAVPGVDHVKPGLIRVDARTGFAHPAIDAGLPPLLQAAKENGVAGLAIHASYNCGVLGHHAERIAEAGFVGLCFTNAPASIAPIGGTRAIVGTNPFAVAVPDGIGGTAMVVDQSASVVAKSEVAKRARAGEPVPEGWVLDPEGRPTTDPSVGLKGTMVPSGGYKGVGVGLLVEVFSAMLSGAELGIDAAPFSGTVGGPPRTGQFMLAIDPGAASAGLFSERMSRLAQAVSDQSGARLPGGRRRAARERAQREGVEVDAGLIARIDELPQGSHKY